jgi:predicted nucleic acid-binding protein
VTFVDANIVLEILLERTNMQKVAHTLKNEKNLVVSTLTVSHVMYFAEKNKVDLVAAEKLINRFKRLDVVDVDITKAFGIYQGQDYEDALQIACAVRNKCTTFITHDQNLAKKYAKTIKIKLVQ